MKVIENIAKLSSKGPIFLLLFSILTSFSIAQPVDIATLKQKGYEFITDKTELAKTLRDIPFDSISIPNTSISFKKIDNKSVIFSGYDPYTYWFRFVLLNYQNNEEDLLLLMGPIGLRKGTLYRVQGGLRQRLGQTGRIYEFKDRPYLYTHYVFPLNLKPKSTDTFYLKIDYGKEFKSYAFVIMKPKTLKRLENSVYFSFGLITGLLLLFAIINLYVFITVKEKIHFWYFIYILLLILILLVNDGLGDEFLNLDSELGYRLFPLLTIGTFAIGTLTYVVQLFLSNIGKETTLYRVTIIIRWNVFLSGIIHYIFFLKAESNLQNVIFEWADKSTVVAIFFILINCFYSIKKGFKPAWFIIIGMSVFLVGALQRLLTISTESYLFPPSIFHIGMVIETAIISFGFIYRNTRDRKEKLQYLNEKINLENSLEKKILETRLEMQEATFRHISQEIHDNLGQVLSLAKLNLNCLDVKREGFEERIENTKEVLGHAITDLRNLSKSLNSDYLIEMGLQRSIEFEINQLKKTKRFSIHYDVIGEEIRVDKNKELILFRIVQEALNNIMKHSGAKNITINLNYGINALIVEIKDDGVGFDQYKLKPDHGFGLKNMFSRAAAIGGSLNINSAHSTGTKVEVMIPLP
jgi:signal transduction histidine kinase